MEAMIIGRGLQSSGSVAIYLPFVASEHPGFGRCSGCCLAGFGAQDVVSVHGAGDRPAHAGDGVAIAPEMVSSKSPHDLRRTHITPGLNKVGEEAFEVGREFHLRHGLAPFVDGCRLEWMGRGCQDLTTAVGKRRGLFAIEDTELNEGAEGFFEPKGDKGD